MIYFLCNILSTFFAFKRHGSAMAAAAVAATVAAVVAAVVDVVSVAAAVATFIQFTRNEA